MRYPAHVAVGDHSDVLYRIHEPDINLAIWERRLGPELERSLSIVAAAARSDSRWLPKVPEHSVSVMLAWDLFRSDLPPILRPDHAEAVRDDIHDCARRFDRVVRPERLTLAWRLENPHPGWPADWHADALRHRLICCGFGDTTIGLANKDVLTVPGKPLEFRKRRWARIYRLPLGAVCIFKGVDYHHKIPPWVHSEPPSKSMRGLTVIND